MSNVYDPEKANLENWSELVTKQSKGSLLRKNPTPSIDAPWRVVVKECLWPLTWRHTAATTLITLA